MPQKPAIIRSVLFTSLPAFLVAEIFFAIIYGLIVSVIQGLYVWIASFSTAQVEANMQILSPLNVTLFVITILALSVVTFFEMATIISITLYDYYRDDHIPLRTLFRFVYDQTRRLLSLKVIPLFLIILFFPKEHIGPKGIFSLQIPPFILDELAKNPLYTWILLGLLGVITYFLYRSIFLLHTMLLEDGSFLTAWRRSSAITHKIGIWRMFLISMRAGVWTVLFSLPILALLFVATRGALLATNIFGDLALLISGGLSWLTNFLFVSLPGVFFLASLTIAYIEENEEQIRNLKFLQKESEPRWKNFRKIFKKKYLIPLVVGLTLLVPVFGSLLISVTESAPRSVITIAHRGYAFSGSETYQDNTIPSILAAQANGADIVEIDFYENADGSLIVLHDPDLRRVAKMPDKIADMTDAAVRAVRLIDGNPIPTLDEVLTLAKEKHIKLIIEAKVHGREKNFVPSIVKLLQKHGLYDTVWVHSLNLPILLEIKKLEPRIRVGYTVFGGIGNFATIPVDFFSVQETLVSPTTVNNVHNAGKELYIWTINDTSVIEPYMKMGVDGIITDQVPAIAQGIQSVNTTIKNNPKPILRVLGYEVPMQSMSELFENFSK